MKSVPRISEAEWEVMKVVWRKSPCLAQEIIQALGAPVQWSPATVKTLLNRLIKKRALRFAKSGKSYLYSPAVGEEELRGAEANSFLQRIFDGAFSPMIAHFVQSRRLTARELDHLEQILREKRKEK